MGDLAPDPPRNRLLNRCPGRRVVPGSGLAAVGVSLAFRPGLPN